MILPHGYFGLLSQIDADRPETWRGRIFLTFDIDWAHDEVLEHCIRLVEKERVEATWFITHQTPLVERLARNPHFELGVHPNFNGLLDGKSERSQNSDSILSAVKELVPDAKSIRSHSLVQSERLVDKFHRSGFSHISNNYVPVTSNSVLAPWKLWDGMTILPHCWQDNVAMRMQGNIVPPIRKEDGGIRVYDFHPIHVFLNSEKIARYEAARPYFRSPTELLKMRNTESIGTEDILREVMGGRCDSV